MRICGDCDKPARNRYGSACYSGWACDEHAAEYARHGACVHVPDSVLLEEAQAEIDRLRSELAWYKDNVRCTDEGPCACNFRAVKAEARIAATIAALDSFNLYPDESDVLADNVRAALTGDNQ